MINDNFIWAKAQQNKVCRTTEFDESISPNYKVYRFKKEYAFGKEIKSVKLDIFADTKYFLYINGKFIGLGPICAGGDYGNTQTMPIQYYDSYELEINSPKLEFDVLVQQDIVVQTDMSVGLCGLSVSGKARLSDNSEEEIATDTSWLASEDKRFPRPDHYEYFKADENYTFAVKQENLWNLQKSEIPLLKTTKVQTDFSPFTVEPKSEKQIFFSTDKIYSLYLELGIKADGEYEITAETSEDEKRFLQIQHISGDTSVNHRALVMSSASCARLTVKN